MGEHVHNAAGTNWAGNLAYGAARIHTPSTVGELQRIVAASDSVRALGTRHSFNTIADGTRELISTAGLTGPARIDRDAGVVTVGAGTSYGHLAVELQEAGWALANLASLPHISVGGATATGTHGSGDTNPSLAAAVVGLDLVTAGGDLVRYDAGQPGFDGVVINLGALGVVTGIDLAIEPTFDIEQSVYEGLRWNELVENFDAVTGAGYSVSVFTSWRNPQVLDQVWLKRRVGSDAPAPAELFGAPLAGGERHPSPGVAPVGCTAQQQVPGPWCDRLPHFRLDFTPSTGAELQSEYLVPRRFAVAALTAVQALGPRLSPLLWASEIRTVAADPLWLSSSFGGDAVGIHFTWKKDQPGVEVLLAEIEQVLEPYAARPHWGKLFTTPPERLETLYPRMADFRALVRELDPDGVFENDFVRRNIFREMPAATR